MKIAFLFILFLCVLSCKKDKHSFSNMDLIGDYYGTMRYQVSNVTFDSSGPHFTSIDKSYSQTIEVTATNDSIFFTVDANTYRFSTVEPNYYFFGPGINDHGAFSFLQNDTL